MQESGWNFYRLMPAPLQTWRIVVASLLFAVLILGIVFRLRRRTETAESLRLNPDRDPSDPQRRH
jgi:hypothetical protein